VANDVCIFNWLGLDFHKKESMPGTASTIPHPALNNAFPSGVFPFVVCSSKRILGQVVKERTDAIQKNGGG